MLDYLYKAHSPVKVELWVGHAVLDQQREVLRFVHQGLPGRRSTS